MNFAHGLSINIDAINKILEIAYLKNYLEKKDYDLLINKCNELKFNEIEDSFEFSILELNICVKLEKNMFIECYTEFLNQ
jgi:hypothetical protein